MSNASLFGTNLRFIRMHKAITQKKLSDMTGINAANISAYEKGVNHPSLDVACRIADALEIGIDKFVTIDLTAEQKELDNKRWRMINGN